jgi:hypothetical protein
MGTCSFQEHAGIPCPGCGIQRSIIALLRGDLLESIILFPALLPMIGMFLFLGVHLLANFKCGALILKILFLTNTILLLAGFAYKIFIQL